MADLYAVLGVGPDATQEEIKRAYRRKARELHPDTGGDEEAFKQVTRAYQILSDPERRAHYDRFGEEEVRVGAGADPFGFGGLADVFDAFFGGMTGSPFRATTTRARSSQPGRDVLASVEVDLEEVASGTHREVQLDTAAVCEECAGSGSRSGGSVTCRTCGGLGQVRRIVRSAFGQLATTQACPDCESTGRTLGDPCPACHGQGRVRRVRTISVEVPAGVEDGDRLRVTAHGEAGRRGGAPGDLYVEVHVRPHEIFTRDGRDLHCEVTVPFVHSALGASLHVPTIDGGTVTVELPAGTQPGDALTVRRAGLPRRGGADRGSLLVQVNIEVPRMLTADEAELLRRFAALRGEETPPAGRSLFQRLREAFR